MIMSTMTNTDSKKIENGRDGMKVDTCIQCNIDFDTQSNRDDKKSMLFCSDSCRIKFWGIEEAE